MRLMRDPRGKRGIRAEEAADSLRAMGFTLDEFLTELPKMRNEGLVAYQGDRVDPETLLRLGPAEEKRLERIRRPRPTQGA